MHPFLKQMILRNTLTAAVQRAGVYQPGTDMRTKTRFRKAGEKWLTEFGARYVRATVTKDGWCDEIHSVCRSLEQEFKHHLRGGRIRFGIGQKMVSLYLKYLWLMSFDEAKRPLFAVLDRGVMKAAGISGNWTHLDNRIEYIRIVEAVDRHALQSGYIDGAQWEADEWPKLGFNRIAPR